MTKKYWLILVALITGCGSDTQTQNTVKSHSFGYQNVTWQIQVPETWEVLNSESGVLFMARSGDENIAILERDLSSQSPAQQIIDSAKNGFFSFEIESQSDNAWSFTGQPSTTTPPRKFWQQIANIPESQKFLLGSCSQHKNSPNKSSCASILKSWKLVE